MAPALSGSGGGGGASAGRLRCCIDEQPLFDISQPTLSHHLKKLREAGVIGLERQGLWSYYYVLPGALKELSSWLSN